MTDDLLPARLVRMKTLIERLEHVTPQSADQRERLELLRVELDVARRDIELFKTGAP